MVNLRNSKGLTLVEVLAALVILGIAMISILTILPQMTLFNAKTEMKLNTMNLAKQEIATVLMLSKWEKVLITNIVDPTTSEPDFLSTSKINTELVNLGYSKSLTGSQDTLPLTSASFVRYEKNSDYRYQADIYLICEPFLLKTPTAAGSGAKEPCAKSDNVKLYKVHMKLWTNKDTANGSYRLSSETYSYIRYTAKKPATATSGGS